MSTDQPPDDPSRSTIVSRSPGLAYERTRDARTSHFGQPLGRLLTLQGGLLAAVAVAFAFVLVADGGPGAGPGPDLAHLGTGSAVLVATGVGAHALVGTVRLRCEPLTEREALALVTVEDAAAYLGLGVGGLLVTATVLAAALSLVAGVGSVGDATAAVGAGATLAAAVALTAGRYLRGRLPREG